MSQVRRRSLSGPVHITLEAADERALGAVVLRERLDRDRRRRQGRGKEGYEKSRARDGAHMSEGLGVALP